MRDSFHAYNVFHHQAQNPWYLLPDSWLPSITLFAVAIALATPWIVNWLNNKPKNSKLKVLGVSVVDQANETHDPDYQVDHHVGRLIIKNGGKFIAKSTEAFLEEIVFEGEERNDFFSVPLIWTHSQIVKDYARDIHPNQTVYLDVLSYSSDSRLGEPLAQFSIGAGKDVDNLSYVCVGRSKILVRMYQESGQVDEVNLEIDWDGDKAPKMTIV